MSKIHRNIASRFGRRSLVMSAGLAIAVILKAMVASAAPGVSQYASGLDNPRGLKFGPDGDLYVAEGGPGGEGSTVGTCPQVPPPVGPYTGSPTGGRISKIVGGVRTTVIDTFPSSQTSVDSGSLVSGVTDIAFIGGTLYALVAGGGCSHGVPNSTNGIYRVDGGGATLIADLAAFQRAHPVVDPNPGDFEPDGSWWSMIAVNGNLYAIEPNHGELDRITPSGEITRVADISASQGHVVPTAIAYHGNFYIGNLNTFPIVDGSSHVYKVNPAGQTKIVASGLTTVLGIAFDRRSRMYVLENTTGGNPFPTPMTGRVVRVGDDGGLDVIVDGLFLPTGLVLGPDGALYVSNVGFGPPPIGLGEVLRIEID